MEITVLNKPFLQQASFVAEEMRPPSRRPYARRRRVMRRRRKRRYDEMVNLYVEEMSTIMSLKENGETMREEKKRQFLKKQRALPFTFMLADR